MANVVIGCRLPHDLRLNVDGAEIHLEGANSPNVFGGLGMTEVDYELAYRLLSQYADAEYIKREMVFKQVNAKAAQYAAIERKDDKAGLEGLDKDTPMSRVEPTKQVAWPERFSGSTSMLCWRHPMP